MKKVPKHQEDLICLYALHIMASKYRQQRRQVQNGGIGECCELPTSQEHIKCTPTFKAIPLEKQLRVD